jgi:hypothetical protein
MPRCKIDRFSVRLASGHHSRSKNSHSHSHLTIDSRMSTIISEAEGRSSSVKIGARQRMGFSRPRSTGSTCDPFFMALPTGLRSGNRPQGAANGFL